MFDLILDSVKDFHTVEERRLHRIFCGLINMAGRVVPAGLYFVTEFLAVFLIPCHLTHRIQSALASPVLWLQKSSTRPH